MKKILLILALCFSTPLFALNAYQPTPLTFQVVTTTMNITKQDVKSVKVFQRSGFYSVDIVLKPAAAKALSTMTSNNINKVVQAAIGSHIINQSKINSRLDASFQLAVKTKSAVKKLIRSLS